MIDLNCDMGESFGRWELGEDEMIMASVSSVNIACGFHAGDPLVMEHTLRLAKAHQLRIGAHPGWPDLQGFGRRVMECSPVETEAYILYQLGALAAFARANGVGLSQVKPHGALYNQAARNRKLAEAIARAVTRFDSSLLLVGLAGSVLIEAGAAAGLAVANEAFPDRAYEPDGSLRARRLPGALIEAEDEVCAQAVRFAQTGILAGGKTIPVDTLCIHGDHPGAAQRAAAIRGALEKHEIAIRSG